MSDSTKYSSIHYNDYLQLDRILGAQELRSEDVYQKPAHEEMLFIIVHQVYELWFKQINHELKSVHRIFSQEDVNEKHLITMLGRLDRVNTILDLIIEQIKVIETMTPLDFLEFRNLLFPASGFQSFQFREMELLLGLKQAQRHTYNNTPYQEVFDADKKSTLEGLESGKSLKDLLEDWLERTPFLSWKNFDFLSAYKEAVSKMIASEKKGIEETSILSDEYKQMRLRMLGDTDSYFAGIWDENNHQKLIEEGRLSLSYQATIAALFINLYRDEPILQMPFQLLSKLVEIDDAVATWRYRHAQMVMRMLGKKVGTGGSSGHEYLSKTARQHHIFADLHNISTLMIPRSFIPELPKEVREQLGFAYRMKG